MKKTRRTERVGELIRNEVSTILQREIQDPQIRFVTITEVEVSVDLRIARVHVSIMGSDEEKQATLDALDRHRGKIRYILGQRVRLRSTPEISFRIDETASHAESIERLLAEVGPLEPGGEPETEEQEERETDERNS